MMIRLQSIVFNTEIDSIYELLILEVDLLFKDSCSI